LRGHAVWVFHPKELCAIDVDGGDRIEGSKDATGGKQEVYETFPAIRKACEARIGDQIGQD
jgi:hypothetical protein